MVEQDELLAMPGRLSCDRRGGPRTYSRSGEPQANSPDRGDNGNIAAWQTHTPKLGANTVGQKYRYDALNRLKKAESFGTGLATNALLSKYSYDQGGNITKIKRHDLSGTIIDSMAYSYTLNGQNKPLTNKLNSVNDLGNATGMPTGSSAYTYDADGRLARDVKESLNMRWTIDNKVRQVQKGNRFIRYWYDATGNRVMKRLHGDTVDYVFRDATGNELERIVRRQNSTSPIIVKRETNIFGSARIGTYLISPNGGNDTTEKRTSAKYTYEITDHLGNVRVTVSDVKTFAAITGGYTLSGNVLSAIDNYPYGMAINSRSFAASTYRFGFGGHEKVDEISGSGNQVDMGDRLLDTRLGRTPKPDRNAINYPGISPYSYVLNNPINAIDPDGRDVVLLIAKEGAQGMGHMAALIQDGKGNWYYMTQGANPTQEEAKGGISKMISGGVQGGMVLVPLNTTDVEEAINKAKQDVNNSPYTDQVILKTSSKMDEKIFEAAQKQVDATNSGEKKYNLITNNCVDACQDPIEQGTGKKLPKDVDPRPNKYFEKVEKKLDKIQKKLDKEMKREEKKAAKEKSTENGG